MQKITFEAVPAGQILVEAIYNRAYGIHPEPIPDKENFAMEVLASWSSKMKFIIIHLWKKARSYNK